MSAVRGRGNATTELALIKLFRTEGLSGWRRNNKISGTRPDFVFYRQQVVIFVDGCFWHRCRWHGEIPSSNKKFWLEKLSRNKARDIYDNKKLRIMGWKVIRIWEHEIKKNPGAVVNKILSTMQKK